MAHRNGKQIEFQEAETHSRRFELFMLGLSILCVIVVLLIILATSLGTEFRPTA